MVYTEKEIYDVIEYHVSMPYNLSLHEFKGVRSNLAYLKLHHLEFFDVLSEAEIISFITTKDNYYKRVCN